MDALSLTVEALRALILFLAGALWAAGVSPRGRDPRHRWRVRLASGALAALIAGSVLLGTDPVGIAVMTVGLAGLMLAADDAGLEAILS